MTNIDVVENKISSIGQYLKILDDYKKYSLESLKKDINLKGALERYLYLAIQSTIDLAEAVISFKKFRKPTEYREAFEILCEERLIGPDLREKLFKMVGFRNTVTHDYLNLDFKIVYEVLHGRLADIENFVENIRKKLNV